MNGRNKNQEIQKELETISPLLAKLRKKDSGFVVPENYFQNLSEEILNNTSISSNTTLAEKENSQHNWFDSLISALQLLLQPRYAMTVAVIGLLIVAGVFWLQPKGTGLSTEVAWSDITTEEMTGYIEANIHEFEVSSLVELAPDIERQSILHNADIEEETLDGYLKEIIEEVEFEDLENLF